MFLAQSLDGHLRLALHTTSSPPRDPCYLGGICTVHACTCTYITKTRPGGLCTFSCPVFFIPFFCPFPLFFVGTHHREIALFMTLRFYSIRAMLLRLHDHDRIGARGQIDSIHKLPFTNHTCSATISLFRLVIVVNPQNVLRISGSISLCTAFASRVGEGSLTRVDSAQ